MENHPVRKLHNTPQRRRRFAATVPRWPFTVLTVLVTAAAVVVSGGLGLLSPMIYYSRGVPPWLTVLSGAMGAFCGLLAGVMWSWQIVRVGRRALQQGRLSLGPILLHGTTWGLAAGAGCAAIVHAGIGVIMLTFRSHPPLEGLLFGGAFGLLGGLVLGIALSLLAMVAQLIAWKAAERTA
ncbi:MAG: hypothetical protein ACLFV7_08730 [Phycisphaerae bacterium]